MGRRRNIGGQWTEIRDCQFLMGSGLSQLILFVSVGQIKARKKRESNCEPFISNHRDNLVKELVIVRLVNATHARCISMQRPEGIQCEEKVLRQRLGGVNPRTTELSM